MNPFVETEEFTKMSCLVLNASITDGQLNMEPGMVDRVLEQRLAATGREKERSNATTATRCQVTAVTQHAETKDQLCVATAPSSLVSPVMA